MKKTGLLYTAAILLMSFCSLQAQEEESWDQYFRQFSEEMKDQMENFSFQFDTSFILIDTMVWNGMGDMRSFNLDNPMKMLEEMMKDMNFNMNWDSLLMPFLGDFDMKGIEPQQPPGLDKINPSLKKKRKVYTL